MGSTTAIGWCDHTFNPQLHRDLGVAQGKKIPAGKVAAAATKGGKVGQRARFAQTLSKLRKR